MTQKKQIVQWMGTVKLMMEFINVTQQDHYRKKFITTSYHLNTRDILIRQQFHVTCST